MEEGKRVPENQNGLPESEDTYKRIVESLSDYIYTVRVESGRVVSTSHGKGCVSVTGYTSEEFDADPLLWYRMVHCKDRETVLAQAAAILSGDAISAFDHRIIHKDGSTRWLKNTPVSMYDRQGSLIAYYGIITDITQDVTERKIMEETLRSHELLLETIINTDPECIKLLATDGSVIMMNRSGLEMIDADSLEQIRGRSVYPLICPEYRGAFITLTGEVFQGKSGRLEFEAVGLKGRRLWLETHAVPMRNEKSEITAMLAITRNMTERKSTEEQLRRLSRAVEQSPASVVITDVKGNMEYVNPAFVETTGYTREEALGRNPSILKSGETSQEEYKRLWKTITSGSEWRGEFHNKKKNGELYWESAIISPVKDEAGKIVNFLAVKEDITERKYLAEEQATLVSELQELIATVSRSQKEWRETFDSITDLIFISDKNCNILKVNRAVEKMLGQPLMHVLGKKCHELLHGNVHQPEYCLGGQCLSTGRPASILMYEPNLEMYIDMKVSPRFGSNNEIIGLIHIIRDVTEQKELEGQLQQAHKMEAVGQLAGGIAHDFNNLLTAIISCGKLLEMKTDSQNPLRVYVEHILDASDRAANVVRGLLAFSRKQMFYPIALNLNHVIQGAQQLMQRAVTEDIDLQFSIAAGALTVMADKTQLEQVLINLFANARDAMPSGGVISIHTEGVEFDVDFARLHGFLGPGKYALVTISDSGAGMNEETKERMFEPFFTTKEVGKGTGLGLAIVYGIIKQHGGHINIDSTQGLGTTVKFYLPLIAAETGYEEMTERHLPERGKETVLFAEDDAIVREITGNLLREFGYDVLEAEDGLKAVMIFAMNKERIRLAVLDVIMPGLNGREVFEEIKKMQPDIRVLFMSGYTSDILQRKIVIEDSLNFIAKPVEPFKLLAKIREILDAVPEQKRQNPS